jgi:hypothetical protein
MTKYCVVMAMDRRDDYGLSWTMLKLILSLLNISVTYFGGSPSGRQPKHALFLKNSIYSSVN